MTLDERKRKILESIIKDYVDTAEPVGSRAVVKRHDLRISPATVRNEMADLEEMGYLEQPHTSAGRIPSEMGFRYYVDRMMKKQNLDEEEVEVVRHILNENLGEWNEVIQKIGGFLSQITNYASFIILPAVQLSGLRYMQIVPLEKDKALLLVVTDLGLIMHRTVEVSENLKMEDFEIISRAFNRVLAGKRMEELGKTDLQSIREGLKQRRRFIDRALEAINSLLDESTGEKVVICGALNILNEPEFKDVEKLKRILAMLEEEFLVRSVIPDAVSEDVQIRIGKENEAEDMKDMSLVLAGYKSFGDMGKIGVIGPVRMEYWKAAGTVESVRDLLEEMINRRF